MSQIQNDPEHRYLSVELDHRMREHFELRMLEENHIPGLLPLTVSDDDGILLLHYDISGKDTLSSLAVNQKLLAADIRQLILTLKHVIHGFKPYLLTPASLSLSAETIYLSPLDRSPSFLCIPGQSAEFSKALSDFLKNLISLTNHDDYKSIVLAYRLYKESLTHPSALERLEQILISQESSPMDSGYAEECASPVTYEKNDALSAPDGDPLVEEIREVFLEDASEKENSSSHTFGIFQKLFRMNEEEKNSSSPDDEEKRWMELMNRES